MGQIKRGNMEEKKRSVKRKGMKQTGEGRYNSRRHHQTHSKKRRKKRAGKMAVEKKRSEEEKEKERLG